LLCTRSFSTKHLLHNFHIPRTIISLLNYFPLNPKTASSYYCIQKNFLSNSFFQGILIPFSQKIFLSHLLFSNRTLFQRFYLTFPGNSLYPLCIFYSFLIAALAILYEEGEELQYACFPSSQKFSTWRCIDDCSRKSRKSGNCFYLA